MDLGPPELILIVIAVLVLFGGSKLPQLARSIGRAKVEFERAAKGEPSPDDVHSDSTS
ncbi:MAG: twin-arginine translocase TatA/TatE family subunit [Ilumatobacteraceae bacterium]|jgi:sec-independent protein translocase protein TatA